MATISDVARLSGMSVSTVSRVINNKPHVSEEKRQKILEAMDALGYSPLQAARQLRGSGSGNIAVVVPTITNNFFRTTGSIQFEKTLQTVSLPNI